MLILSRKKGQIVDIGPVAITVEAIDRTGISVRVECPANTGLLIRRGEGTPSREIPHNGRTLIAMPSGSVLSVATENGTTEMRPCAPSKRRPGAAPLGFTAPRHVGIWRRELKLRGAA